MSEFINKIAPIAIKIGKEYNILPSLIIAQGILESASGTSELAKNANNLFGIKKGSGWNGEIYTKRTSEQKPNGEVFYITADFRKYKNYDECIKDLCYKYTHGTGWEKFNRYEKVVGEIDYKKATKAIIDAGYATDVKYSEKLNSVIEKYELNKFNKEDDKLKLLKIGICAGHGFNTAGKRTPDGEREWTFNDKLVRSFIAEMAKYDNVEIKRFDDPTGKTDVPLTTRTDNANKWGADIYISFHHNANASKWGTHTGVETYVYTNPNPEAVKLAKAVHPYLVKAYGLKDRGIKKKDLHIVRETDMPAILIEGGFMDSTIDIKKLRDDNVLKNAGIGIAKGVAEYANLKGKTDAAPGKLMWGKTEFKKGQIGRINIVKPINLWKEVNGKLVMERILNPGEQYRVYGFRSDYNGQYDVGGGMWITKIDTHIKYETPSKALLEQAKKL